MKGPDRKLKALSPRLKQRSLYTLRTYMLKTGMWDARMIP
jgi:hypothetical protein